MIKCFRRHAWSAIQATVSLLDGIDAATEDMEGDNEVR